MSRWTPCKRREFIQKLQELGLAGPFSGSKHQFMIYHECRLTIPSNDEYSVPQLRMMIREVEEIIDRQITLEQWNGL